MPQINMQDGNHLNNSLPPKPSKRSNFSIKKPLAFTPRFGEITPFFEFRGESSDKISMRSSFDLRTFSLQSPLMRNLTMHKNYFQVPMEAILPFNWDTKIYPNPTIGDDVPEDAYTFGDYSFIRNKLATYSIPTPSDFSQLGAQVQGYTVMSMFYFLRSVEVLFSSNSLANNLGYGLPRYDFLYPSIADVLNNGFCQFSIRTVDGAEIFRYNVKDVNLHWLLSMCDDYLVEIVGDTDDHIMDFTNGLYNALKSTVSTVITWLNSNDSNFGWKFNLDKILAYQLVCAHYYTNDKVDFIYTSELWRQNFVSLCCPFNDGFYNTETFSYNGVAVQYDYLSYHFLKFESKLFNDSFSYTNLTSYIISYRIFAFVLQLFGYRRSLKYMDYFTGARPQPLAVGNTDVNVSSSDTVDVVDITRKIQWQRFANFIMRTGRKPSNYIAGLFDVVPKPDWHNPQFLAHTSEVVYGSETENTGAAQFEQQNNITTNLRCNANRYEFSLEIDRPSIILGLLSFDIERFYKDATLRDNFYKDRFDMFNPFLQFVGDQPLYQTEYSRNMMDGAAFGYETRYLEYKMGFPRATGGFATDALPSWIFDAQDYQGVMNIAHITPEFIRSNPSELDKFFLNGVGNRTDNYFHFICLVDNEVKANRPMVVAPQILG